MAQNTTPVPTSPNIIVTTEYPIAPLPPDGYDLWGDIAMGSAVVLVALIIIALAWKWK